MPLILNVPESPTLGYTTRSEIQFGTLPEPDRLQVLAALEELAQPDTKALERAVRVPIPTMKEDVRALPVGSNLVVILFVEPERITVSDVAYRERFSLIAEALKGK